jgi:hypothetical protein
MNNRLPQDFIPPLQDGGCLVALLAPHAASEAMLTLAARLAQRGPVRVLDGGNRFNAYRVAHALAARRLSDLRQALERIRVRRAFTCYQAATILASTQSGPAPLLVLDLLATFYDENVRVGERRQLLEGCIAHLRRLAAAGPVVVSLRPPAPPHQDPNGLLPLVQAAADTVFFQEECSEYRTAAALTGMLSKSTQPESTRQPPEPSRRLF